MNILCKSSQSRVLTEMLKYYKQTKETHGTNITKVCSEIPHKNLHRVETTQSTCYANQLTGFHTSQAHTKRHLRTDHNKNIDCILRNTPLTC